MKSRSKLLVLCALALLGLAVAFYFRLRSRPTASDASDASKASDRATHRTNLTFQAGHWLLPGTTNAFTGFLLDTYDDGARKSLSAVSNGLLHGLSIGWHTNGQQQVEEHFVLGVSHGLRTKWHPNGQKLSEVAIVDGQLQSTFRTWHENGVLAQEVQLKDGQPDGLSKAYFPSGYQKSQVTLRNGKVVEQQFWKDGEHQDPPASELSAK